jgi:UDP-N-acetylmuramyl pentapeptide synthase
MKTVEEISQYCNGELVGNMHLSSIVIQQIYIDSRAIFQPHATMFVALKTDRRNGHDFIESAYQKGVRIFLVQKEYLISNSLSDAIFIKIDDTLQGLQLIATKIRETCNYPVIGITGSNGKTIVKDWLLQLFPNNFQIIASPKSFNSQIGVPLSVWKMEPNYNLGIFEAGISEAGEMEILEKMIQPTCGILLEKHIVAAF